MPPWQMNDVLKLLIEIKLKIFGNVITDAHAF